MVLATTNNHAEDFSRVFAVASILRYYNAITAIKAAAA